MSYDLRNPKNYSHVRDPELRTKRVGTVDLPLAVCGVATAPWNMHPWSEDCTNVVCRKCRAWLVTVRLAE